MAANDTAPVLPNPLTPLAWLMPTLADQYETSRYVFVATLGAFVWDLLISIPPELKLIRHHRSFPTLVYFVSRIGTLAWVLSSTIFQIAPTGNCEIFNHALGWCTVVAVPGTAFLFFLRIKAIFFKKWIIVGFFFLIWLSALGTAVTVPFALEGAPIGETNYCINIAVKPMAGAVVIINMINGTLVFLTISWKLISMNNETSRVQAFVKARGLSHLSSAILQSGQLYYFATVGLNIVTVAMLYSSAVPPVFHAMFTVPNVALENAMACRVFRMLKFDVKRNYIDTIVADTYVNSAGNHSGPIRRSNRHTDVEVGLSNLRTPVQVSVTKDSEGDDPTGLSYKVHRLDS